MVRETSYFVQAFNAGKGGIEGRRSDSLQIGNRRAANGGEIGVEQTWCRGVLVNRRSGNGRL